MQENNSGCFFLNTVNHYNLVVFYGPTYDTMTLSFWQDCAFDNTPTFCRAMLCISAACAVMLCLSVRSSVTFVDSVETNKHRQHIFTIE